jgi:hypothetical protein
MNIYDSWIINGPSVYLEALGFHLIFPPISGSIDLKSMQAEHGSDIVPPSTRTLNYIALCWRA